ncbi:MAG: hypothetical protein JW894_02500 [Bacteroidales bacterium]|nr:hypothetical protein [Bacteroidales bacterium]
MIKKAIIQSLELMPTSLRYRQGKRKNILVFANRRGGSTLIRQMLSVDHGIRAINEPFAMFEINNASGKIKRDKLPGYFMSQFISVTEQEKIKILGYITDLLQGKHLPFKFYCRGERTLLKIVNAHPLIDLLTNNFDVQTMLFLRHPIAQALSVVRNNWGFTAEAYLKNPGFLKKYCTKNQVDFGNKLLTKGSKLGKAVLSWVFENLFPLKFSMCDKYILHYESMLMQPEKYINILADKFEIINKKKMYEVMHTPSYSVHRSNSDTIQRIKESKKTELINAWLEKLSKPEKEKVQRILDYFEIDNYSAFDPMPVIREDYD